MEDGVSSMVILLRMATLSQRTVPRFWPKQEEKHGANIKIAKTLPLCRNHISLAVLIEKAQKRKNARNVEKLSC